ncbi:MAG: BMP family ABC transporter substrate-binding protein, partial [Arenicellales bacterium]|nr:BMP family ABC transporter substrate-binding protein [Arenicellales bacterium]
LRDYAAEGYDLVIAHGSQYGASLQEIAPDFPETSFAWGTTADTFGVPNIFAYEARSEEGGYVNGVLAASLSESGIIGVVGPIEVGDAKLYVDGFTAGAEATNPDIQVNANWIGSFSDVALASEAAQTHLNAGADVLTGTAQMVVGAIGVAETNGVIWLGTQSDQSSLAPSIVAANQVYDWTVALEEIVALIGEGTLGGKSFAATMSNGGLRVDFNPDFAMGADAKAAAEAALAAVTSGDIDALAAAGEVAAAKTAFKAAFVYVAPIGDLGWTWAHDQARQQMEADLGIETAYIEMVPEGPEGERVIRDFAMKGYDLIFTTSFGYMDPTITVAEEFPDIQFVHISGFKSAPNASNVFGRMYQPRYLSGLVAGAATESNIIGYVAAFPIPEVIRGINAFTLGVREVNPAAEVRVVWTNTWFGPPEEKEAADALLAAGADIIAQHQDTTEPQKAAADAGALSIGYDSDMAQFVGDTVLTSPIWNWGVKYVEIAEQVMAGTYDGSESYWGGMPEGVVALAPLSGRVSADTAALVDEKSAAIVSGDWDVFCGPVVGANGSLVVAEGDCLDDGSMLGMDYWVEGVSGEVPGEAAGAAEGTYRVALILPGRADDVSWNQAAYEGMLWAQENAGGDIEVTVVEQVYDVADIEPALLDYAQQGYNLVVGHGFQFQEPIIKVSEDYPDVHFALGTGFKLAPNVGVYDVKLEQGGYVMGILAGMLTESNIVGVIGGLDVSEIHRGHVAFMLGAEAANPDVTVLNSFIGDFNDLSGAKEAALNMITAEADVLWQSGDGIGIATLNACAEQGVTCMGNTADQNDIEPEITVVSNVYAWGPMFVQMIEESRGSVYGDKHYWIDFGNDGQQLVWNDALSDLIAPEIQEKIDEARQGFIDGSLDLGDLDAISLEE